MRPPPGDVRLRRTAPHRRPRRRRVAMSPSPRRARRRRVATSPLRPPGQDDVWPCRPHEAPSEGDMATRRRHRAPVGGRGDRRGPARWWRRGRDDESPGPRGPGLSSGSPRGLGVEARGLEPLTPCLQSRCATSCATPPGATGAGAPAVGLRGLEPLASSLSGKRSNRLSYRPGTPRRHHPEAVAPCSREVTPAPGGGANGGSTTPPRSPGARTGAPGPATPVVRRQSSVSVTRSPPTSAEATL